MKKDYTLKKVTVLPQKSTIDFLLNFSRSISVMKVAQQNFTVSKN